MQKEEIIHRISKVIDDYLEDNISMDEKIFSKSKIDSLDMLIIIVEIEEEFGIEIPDSLIEEIATEELSIEGLADKLMSKYELA